MTSALAASGLSVGVRVVRGPDWKWGNQDDGEGKYSSVLTRTTGRLLVFGTTGHLVVGTMGHLVVGTTGHLVVGTTGHLVMGTTGYFGIEKFKLHQALAAISV